jgi:hypothetical protein
MKPVKIFGPFGSAPNIVRLTAPTVPHPESVTAMAPASNAARLAAEIPKNTG